MPANFMSPSKALFCIYMNSSRGSEWRKWDLHVHTPFTKCNDGYESLKPNTWDNFCKSIEESSVSVIGITDYFSLDNYYIFVDKFHSLYPHSSKIFFPNIELRLNESVNPVQEEVNVHLIFRPDIDKETAKKFIDSLKTEKTDRNEKKLSCGELENGDFEGATVTRENIILAFEETFGPKAIRQDYMLIFAATNNDGIRPERGKKRKEIITDEIDKLSDGFFGGSQNTEHFLDKARLEDKQQSIKEKPVITGCDAHSFDQLNTWLGKTVINDTNTKEITWIKADTTFEGLLQILIDPRERVAISPTIPDEKELYKVIKKISFTGTNNFPKEIVFNNNLNSIIGSRSSGKSALLNYVAHAVDKIDTESKCPNGPAAKIAWQGLGFGYSVEWGDGNKDNAGKVIFLPQNYLFSISNHPEMITEKIKPVLFRRFPLVQSRLAAVINAIESNNKSIEDSVGEFFNLTLSIRNLEEETKTIGDKKVINQAKENYDKQVNQIKGTFSLTNEEVEKFQKISAEITEKRTELQVLTEKINILKSQYINQVTNNVITIVPSITFNPSIENLPSELRAIIEEKLSKMKIGITKEIEEEIIKFKSQLETRHKEILESIEKISKDNKDVIQKNQQNEQLAKLINESNKQISLLSKIEDKEKRIKLQKDKIQNVFNVISTSLAKRDEAIQGLRKLFLELNQKDYDISFGVECSFSVSSVMELSENFNLREISDNEYISDQKADILKIRKNYKTFLEDLDSGKIKLKVYKNAIDAAKLCLKFTEEIRFNAVMEGDTIGGFNISAMTPGKQALFALMLILDESTDAWPLLIDQPEDDLDSRSIYNHIVPYLKLKKKERQIIMVSHNANLVVGADSEKVIVANKHGDDRKNINNQMFDYFSGSLENTKQRVDSAYILDSGGIREHACDILDGGEEAFEKRKNKYKI